MRNPLAVTRLMPGRLRIASLAGLIGLASIATLAVAPAAANAATVSCALPSGVSWTYGNSVPVDPGTPNTLYRNYFSAKQLVSVSDSEVFTVSQSLVGINPSDNQGSVQFVSSVSNSYSVATQGATVNFSIGDLIKFFKNSVSQTITNTTTTTLGVNYTAIVPPHSQVIGEYGVEEFNVTYNEVLYTGTYLSRLPDTTPPTATHGTCSSSTAQYTATAPTTLQGWEALPPTPLS